MSINKLNTKHYLLIIANIVLLSLTGYFTYKYYYIQSNNSPVVNKPTLNNKPTSQNRMGNNSANRQGNYIDNLPKEELSDSEKNSLIEMVQEEKLAHDVYITLAEKWNLQVFYNISKAETQHQSAIENLLQRYEIENPVDRKKIGEFADDKFTQLYNNLIEQGSKSEIDALKVGATIEDLDIDDLNNYLKEIDNQDIIQTFTLLKRGSENHLRAFSNQLSSNNTQYIPQYISQDEYNKIISK